MERGDTDWSVSDDSLCCLKWKDKRIVYLLTNFHDPCIEVEVNRKNKDGTVSKVSCPAALQDYNQHMNFVDKFDQRKGQYEIDKVAEVVAQDFFPPARLLCGEHLSSIS